MKRTSVFVVAFAAGCLAFLAGATYAQDTGMPAGAAEPATASTAAEALAAGTAAPPAEPSIELIELESQREAPGAQVAQGAQGSDLITITLDNVPLQDVVRMFTRISGANIVAGTNLAGNVTVSLQNVEWKPALNVILDSVNMALVEKKPGIFVVMSRGEIASEPVTMDTVYLKYTTVSNIVPVVSVMLVSTNASVAGFAAANAVVIQETASRLAVIKDVIGRIDVPRAQVFIEAKFVELNEQAIKDIGVNWEVLQGYTIAVRPEFGYTREQATYDSRSKQHTEYENQQTLDSSFDRSYSDEVHDDVRLRGNLDDSFSTVDGTVPNPPTIEYGSVVESFDERTIEDSISDEQHSGDIHEESDLSYVTDSKSRGKTSFDGTDELLTAILSAETFALTLSALKQNDGVEVVSNPRIVVASGETAFIHVGRNEPNIVAQPQGDNVARYAYALDPARPFIEIGVRVEVTPTVNTESNITVRIVPELSRWLRDKVVGEAGMSFPVTQVRRIETLFNIEGGKTVAIGGLTSSEDTERIKKIPLLGDIPIIGKYLFRHTHTETIQDEVIIFVTVGLASPAQMNSSVGIPTEGKLIHRRLAKEAARTEAAAKQQGAGEKEK